MPLGSTSKTGTKMQFDAHPDLAVEPTAKLDPLDKPGPPAGPVGDLPSAAASPPKQPSASEESTAALPAPMPDGLAALAGQGLKIGLAAVSSGFGGREDLLWNAMDMVKAMGDPEKVLPMLTANNADILGVGDRLGRIAVGLRADLVVWSANPLTTFKAQVETTYIKGRQVYRKGDAMRCYL